ncbi:MAG: hypothetical protein OHK0023_03370 [Anaerolineae bacterium]
MQADLELYREEFLIADEPPVRLSYIEIIPEAPRGTLIFVHGYGGYAMQWKHQLRAFADDYRVIAYDVRGHGRSNAPYTHYDMDEHMADLRALIEYLRVQLPMILVGHSFGGALVTEFATRYPNDVARLVLIAATGDYRIQPVLELGLRLPLAIMRPIQRLARKSLAAPAHALKYTYFNAMRAWDGWAKFPQLKMPVLVIRGDRDEVYPTADFKRVLELVGDVEDVNIGVSRHLVPLERADAVNRAIIRFIEGQSEAPAWRDERRSTQTTRYKGEFEWYKHYESGVPHTLPIPNRPLHRLLAGSVRRYGGRPALVFYGKTLTYRQLDAEVNKLANALRSLGVERGTRVMILLPNTPQFVIAYFAVLKAGGVVVSTSPVNEKEELTRQISDSESQILITLTLYSITARYAMERSSLRSIIFTNIKEYMGRVARTVFGLMHELKEGHYLSDGLQKREYSWRNLLSQHPSQPPRVEVEATSTAVIKYTGGTTDLPKGVMLSHRALIANALQVRHWVTHAREGREVVLAVLPFSHAYGMTAAMNVSIALGAQMVILPTFITADVLRHIKRYKPTLFPGVPTMYTAINNFPKVRSYGIKSIKACISGAAPLPVEVAEAFEKLTKGRLVEGYGLTEAGPVTHANPLYGQRKVGSIGVPLPSTEACILDLVTGEPLPTGQIGELAVRGPQIMQGYAGSTDQPFTADGWLLTGDIARADEDGYFQIISRRKDMILAGKYQVYPRDVEEVLYEHPGVQEVAVVGLTTEGNGEQRVKAYVVPRPGSRLSAQELIALCKRRLQEYAVPWEIEFRTELPKSFVGKVLRRLLLEESQSLTPPEISTP